MSGPSLSEFLSRFGLPLLWSQWISAFLAAFVILNFIMINVMVLIYLLRRILGFIQSRLGPNRVGPQGIFQTLADAIKLMGKEDVIPGVADRLVFIIAPAIAFIPAYLVYIVIPWGDPRWFVPRDLNVGVLFISAITSVGVIGIISGGWSSNNKYSLLGAMRSASQMVSYEIPLVLAVMGPALLAQSLRLSDIVGAQGGGPDSHGWFIFYQPVGMLLYLTAALAEINITPFDIVEAESELVAGFHTEYSGMKFALFFLAEFANSFTVAALATTFFLGGWRGFEFLPWHLSGPFWFLFKCFLLTFIIIWIRGTLPRVRVDQLMELGWKVMIPIALLNLLVNALWVSAGWPYWSLALVNWGVLIGAVALGLARRRLPGVLRLRSRAEVAVR